uniref:RING-type domain-containing protein n=1 Tax=Ascaris lumbricoides TaxID=6252 RepID=A0A0M3ISR5_ASCLU
MNFSIRLNGGFSLEIPRRQVIAKLLNSEARSLTSMIESIVTCATNWRDREFYRSLKTFAMPALKRKDVIEITEPFPYSRMYQSEMLLGALNIIPLGKMVAAVCEEHEASRTKENFEAIGSEGKESVCMVFAATAYVNQSPTKSEWEFFQLNVTSLCCSACATCFCVECEGIPHWPLTCGQFEEWTEKFDPQYQWEVYRLDGKLKEHLITRKCYCGVLIELPDNIGIAKCSACWLTYYWDTGKTNLLYTTCYYGKDEHGKHIRKPPEAEMVSQRKAPTLVNRLYAPQCALARRKRFDVPEMRSMVAGLMHQPSLFRQSVSATKLADLRNTALHLLEYGTAWLFVNRLSPPENWKQIRNHLTKIVPKLDAAASRLSSRSDSDLRVQQFAKALDSLEAAIAEIISLFRLSALHLLEYGTAWLFVNRLSPPENWKQIRNHLTKIVPKLDATASRLSSRSDSDLRVQQLNKDIDSLEAIIAEIISLLKHSI